MKRDRSALGAYIEQEFSQERARLGKGDTP
jgi:hypothetical protein